jgi:two-component system sensor histidine kinase KdpD
MDASAVVLVRERTGELTALASFPPHAALEAAELGVAKWVVEHGRAAGLGTDTLPGSKAVCLPLQTAGEPIGVLALIPRRGRFDAEQRSRLEALSTQGALALERAVLAREAEASALRAKTEEMRSSLLSAVSHDLRTPLAAITGAVSALRDESARITGEQRGDLLATIAEEAERLERLVGNLLEMTQVESGSLRVRREWVPLEEIVGAALTRMERSLGARPIRVSMAPELPLLSVDPVLFQQVFVNLLENALKYTPPGSEIEIEGGARGDGVTIEVKDRGPGIPPGDEARVFEKFYRGAHPAVAGAGLGLAICKGIVEAHGGTIEAENRAGGGALFRIVLQSQASAPDGSVVPEGSAS